MKLFTDKKDADACLAALKSTALPFCPIINSKCNCECICFQFAYIRAYYPRGGWAGPKDDQDIAKKYGVYPNTCTHVLIMGDIQISQ